MNEEELTKEVLLLKTTLLGLNTKLEEIGKKAESALHYKNTDAHSWVEAYNLGERIQKQITEFMKKTEDKIQWRTTLDEEKTNIEYFFKKFDKIHEILHHLEDED